MATTTYTPIQTLNGTGSSATITFSSIPSTYTDLVLVAGSVATTSGAPNIAMTFNNDTTSNYSSTLLEGNGSSATSSRRTSTTSITEGNNISLGGSTPSTVIYQIMNYANTTTYKTVLIRNNEPSTTYPGTGAVVGLWRKTPEAINRIDLNLGSGNFSSTSTFTLYGIANANTGAKATGGVITYDNTYYYHTFGASGTFTPQQSLTADVLLVAGGGGSGRANMTNNNGGAGAGGYRLLTSNSLTATAYTVTVGGGGAGATVDGNPGSKGGNSSLAGSGFTTIASTGGGYSHPNSTPGTGGSGGGGGSFNSQTGAAGNEGGYTPVEGYAGGQGRENNNYPAGGGGGAGAVGGTPANSTSNGGAGGVGSSSASSWGLVTGTGENISGTVYYAGGGGGGVTSLTAGAGGYGGGGAGSSNLATNNGLANTGGGAGGSGGAPGQKNGANGGSGVVVIRYLKA